jgi:hypothetical protein
MATPARTYASAAWPLGAPRYHTLGFRLDDQFARMVLTLTPR